MSGHQFDSAKLMCIHGRARAYCAECIVAYARCRHGQLQRVCRECELEAEIEAPRREVSELSELVKASTTCLAETERELEQAEAKLADCQAVIRHKGHDADCPAYPNNLDGSPRGWIGKCSDACGHDRALGGAS